MRLFPQGAWFGLTRKRLKAVGWTLVTLLSLCIVLYGTARIWQALEYRRAAVFLEELKGIQSGQSEASVMPFILRSHGITFQEQYGIKDDSYISRVDPWHLWRALPGPDWADHSYRNVFLRSGNWRRNLKLRAWAASGWVRFSNGKVESVSGGLVIEGENEWLMAEWHYGPNIPAYRRARLPNNSLPVEAPQYSASWTHLHFGSGTGEGILTSVTPRSSPEEMNAARNVNLQCLMSGRGCRSLCELMPDANRYRREHNDVGWGWSSGDWGIQPHDCE
jgi:hypothetical protein